MAVTYANMLDGVYRGNMSDGQISIINTIRGMTEVSSLKKYIYVFPSEIVKKSVEDGTGPLKYCKKHGIDVNEYLGELRDYQTVGVAFMYYSPRSILGDGVGLGKTVEMSALLNVLRVKGELTKFIVAVENTAQLQVQEELLKFTGLNTVVLPSLADQFSKTIVNINWDEVDGVVVKHSSLKSDSFQSWLSQYIDASTGKCKLFNTFILDESSVVKNGGTKMYNYTMNISNCMGRVHFLNATAFEICLMDIYYQVDMLDPNVLPKKWRIEKEYCSYWFKPYYKSVGGAAVQKYSRQLKGYKNEEKFKKSLSLYYFGRAKEVALGADKSIYKFCVVEPTIDQLVAIKRKYRYMEVLNCPSLIDGIKVHFNTEEVPKLKKIVQLVTEDYNNCKVMIYCFHVDAQKVIKTYLEEAGKNVVILSGETKEADRKGIMSEFNEGSANVIITNVKKSLNLYNGDVCIFYSVETNPAMLEQIHGRIDRNVDEKIKTYIMMLYKDTPEYDYLTSVVAERGKDARALTIDAKSTIDKLMESMIIG